VELDQRLPVLLKGEAKPAGTGEQIELAQLCRYKQLHAAEARFYRDAFSARPELAADPKMVHRYNAVCAAALAGCGQGKDAGPLAEPERARLRDQARDWLRAELGKWAKVLDSQPVTGAAGVRQWMEFWQQDTDLAGERDATALDKLPEAERLAWQTFWKDVEALAQCARK
jgi:hypothetical protein